jgi:hypothetical protein
MPWCWFRSISFVSWNNSFLPVFSFWYSKKTGMAVFKQVKYEIHTKHIGLFQFLVHVVWVSETSVCNRIINWVVKFKWIQEHWTKPNNQVSKFLVFSMGWKSSTILASLVHYKTEKNQLFLGPGNPPCKWALDHLCMLIWILTTYAALHMSTLRYLGVQTISVKLSVPNRWAEAKHLTLNCAEVCT